MADQIMAADKTRLKSLLGTLNKTDLLAVEDAIKVRKIKCCEHGG